MDYEVERRSEQPSLAEMTRVALERLEKGPNGFLLMVEGGRIDHAHHENRAKMAMEETLALEKAVEVAMSLTKREETLTIVTADHSHAVTIMATQSAATQSWAQWSLVLKLLKRILE